MKKATVKSTKKKLNHEEMNAFAKRINGKLGDVVTKTDDLIKSIQTYKIKYDKEYYADIEELIIRWNIDGTKTAGHLTRQIIRLLKKKQNGKH